MSDVIDYVIKKENLKRTSAIRLEIDYELLTLFDAIQAESEAEKLKAKERLESLVFELNALNKME